MSRLPEYVATKRQTYTKKWTSSSEWSKTTKTRQNYLLRSISIGYSLYCPDVSRFARLNPSWFEANVLCPIYSPLSTCFWTSGFLFLTFLSLNAAHFIFNCLLPRHIVSARAVSWLPATSTAVICRGIIVFSQQSESGHPDALHVSSHCKYYVSRVEGSISWRSLLYFDENKAPCIYRTFSNFFLGDTFAGAGKMYKDVNWHKAIYSTDELTSRAVDGGRTEL